MRFFLLLLMGFSSFAFAGQSDLIIRKHGEVFDHFNIGFYEDKSAEQTFENIKKINKFTPHSNRISQGYSDSSFWLKFKIKNITNLKANYFITFTENMAHKLECYIESSHGEYAKYEQGVGFFTKNISNKLKKPKFKINLNSGEAKTVYIRMFSIYPNMTSLYILDEQSLNRYTLKYYIFYSLFIGATLALLLYNLVIYFFTRDKSYLYYVAYGSLFLCWQLMLNGFFPLNTFNSTSSFYMFGILAPLWVSFLIFFSINILNTKILFPTIYKRLKYTGYLYLLLSLSTLFFLQQSYIIINVLVTFIFPYLLYIGIKSYFSGNKTALFFIVAQISFMTTSTLFALLAYGYLEYNFITRHGVVIGSLIEIILFSLALAYRIKVLQNEKLVMIHISNIELDKKVKERTRELEHSREMLKELSNRDPMTNLYNRRFLYEISNELINIAKRENSSLSIIIFDIDHFKDINDTHGHSVGDLTIKTFSKLLENTRKSDIAIRFGGEEFILLLPNTDQYGAYEIATQIRKDTAKLKIQVDNDTSINFTVSGGVDTFVLEHDDVLEQSLQRGDKALYNAKKNGRNQIILST